jgi:hypothetical protein
VIKEWGGGGVLLLFVEKNRGRKRNEGEEVGRRPLTKL